MVTAVTRLGGRRKIRSGNMSGVKLDRDAVEHLSRREIAVKRFVVLVAALSLLPSGAAAAQRGADLGVKESPSHVKATGRLTVKLRPHGHRDRRRALGIPEAGFPIERASQALPTTVRPFICENGTYRVVSGTFETVERASATALRPPPYPAAFGNAFPDIFTFVGTLDAVVQNEAGEQFRLLMSDLAHEVITPIVHRHRPIHAYIVDAAGHDRARWSGGSTSTARRARPRTRSSTRAPATRPRRCSARRAVFGPFFVLPFPTTVTVGSEVHRPTSGTFFS